MSPQPRKARWPLAFGVLAALCATPPRVEAQVTQLDDSWTVTVNGQVVDVLPNGYFRVPNISAADNFGQGGPGTRPDFVSDDFLRVIATSTKDGKTQYAVSQFFQIRRGQTFRVGELIFSTTPPFVPVSLDAAPDQPVLTAIDATTQIRVTATLGDGSKVDATPRTSFSIYRVSNPAIATVDQNGLLTAHDAGRVFVTVTNQGTTSVTQVQIVPGDPLTTVVGFAELEDGTPLAGATICLSVGAFETTSGSDGGFTFTGIPTQLGDIVAGANGTVGGKAVRGFSEATPAVPKGLTDVGVVTALPVPDVRVLAIGGNSGNRATNQVFSSGDLPGSVVRVSSAQFDAMSVAELREGYDVLLFTWASPNFNADWTTRLLPYMALGGGVLYEDPNNVGDLRPGVVGFTFNTFGPSVTASIPGLTDGIVPSFANNHIRFTSWDSRLQPFLAIGSTVVGLAGEFPGGGRIVLTGPDQDFHAFRSSFSGPARNQYNLLLNSIRWVARR